jgi:hypothetical protein
MGIKGGIELTAFGDFERFGWRISMFAQLAWCCAIGQRSDITVEFLTIFWNPAPSVEVAMRSVSAGSTSLLTAIAALTSLPFLRIRTAPGALRAPVPQHTARMPGRDRSARARGVCQ